ncbi:hypothetical protein Ate02nite_66470 [Paractinoplanes tereljensis]|uniref:Uncharacterized protein n=1 Tax=Paractinoplanes tereljensis TaxID=571912 RepID=A0A919TXH9_9ACTN|nr:hypothetical protein Ate02nite_66470 [Actinoplanes tereljensis]
MQRCGVGVDGEFVVAPPGTTGLIEKNDVFHGIFQFPQTVARSNQPGVVNSRPTLRNVIV